MEILKHHLLFSCKQLPNTANRQISCLKNRYLRSFVYPQEKISKINSHQTRMKVIIDTDMGLDDACALILALTNPKIEVLAITTVFGNVTVRQAVANASRIRRLVHRENVPIFAGADIPLISAAVKDCNPGNIHGVDGLGDCPNIHPVLEETDFEASVPGKHAALAIIDLIHANPGLRIICLGPLSNIALAVKLDPSISKKLGHLYLMGGNIHAIGNVPVSYTAEFNFFMDPEAAHIVLSDLNAPITALPWETYLNTPCSKEFESSYTKKLSTVKGRFVNAILKSSAEAVKAFENYGLCDEMVTAIAIDPSIILASENRYHATVELNGMYTRGQVALDYRNSSGKKPNVEFVTQVDMGKAEAMLMESLQHSN